MGKQNDKQEKNTETALAVTNYAVMHYSLDQLREVIGRNFGAGSIRQGDLDRVRVPTGGNTTWTIPTFDGERESKHLDGVIVAWKEPRAYWKQSFASQGGGNPPDCASEDGQTGVGDPGGLCHKCPWAQFGSATRDDGSPGDGQACKQMRMMAIVQQDDLVPILLAAPPKSLGNMNRYFLRLASRALPYYAVITRFTLEKKKNKSNIEYSEIQATALETLPESELAKMRAYAESIGNSLERDLKPRADDIAEHE